jgi:Flp pilus assembly protein TadG
MTMSTFQKTDSGSVIVEAAIIFSALLFLLVGIIEFGMAFWQWNTLTFAVEHAGRYMMVSDTGCTSSTCATDAENCMRGQPSNSPVCASTAQIAWIGNPPSVCSTRGTLPVTPPASKACVYATYSAGNTTSNPPVPPTVTLLAEYDMDWTILQALASLFPTTLNGPVIQAQVTVPLD